MRLLFRSLPFLVLAFSLFAVTRRSPAQATQFRITGIVINSTTGDSVARCHLDASLTQRSRNFGPGRRGQSSVGADTDEHGHFSINLPSAGTWHLTATALGYVSQAYDAHGTYSSAVVLTTASPSINLQFRLPPQARITGSVLDEAEEPVRTATVGLFVQTLASPTSSPQRPFVSRGVAQTDDRGSYEFAGLPPGDYRLSVQARPWYASATQQRPFVNGRTQTTDPSLDLTYPPMWYPGVDDSTQSETISLAAGDERHADFHLVPIPSIHLQIIPPAAVQVPGQPPVPAFPIVERVDAIGNRLGQPQFITSNGPQGVIDIGGLSPGTYRVTLQGQNLQNRSTVIQVSEGSSRTLDLREPSSDTAKITVHVEGDDDDDQSLMFELVDTVTGQRYSPLGGGRQRPPNVRRGPSGQSQAQSSFQMQREISLQVPPGHYEITTQSRNDIFLTRVSAQGAEVAGRFITVSTGEVSLTLHTALGRATVTGIATMGGTPCAGAVIMLVPAGLNDAGSFTTLARDQSNTDGSFEMEDVVPGQYLLIAVDRGWHVNWSDAATLRNYLAHGIPLELGREKKIRQNIEAQSP